MLSDRRIPPAPRRPRRLSSFTAILPALALAACASAGPPQTDALSVREIGPLDFHDVILARDGGYSARFGDQSVWVFGDTVLASPGEDGSQWRSSTWCWTTDFDASDGLAGLTDPLDSMGAPGEFLPFTAEELEHNRAHFSNAVPDAERTRWALWPAPVVVDPATGKALVFYARIFAGHGAWNFEGRGMSIATWDDPTQPVVRPEIRAAGPDATILFPADDVQLGQAALADGEWLYAYGCQTQGLSWPCIIGRVRFADALDRDAWEFYAGDGLWSADWKQAQSIMQAAPQLTVHWNEHLGKYLAIYNAPLQNIIRLRTADRPEGPWSDSHDILQCVPPTNDEIWTYCGLGHPELARDGGRVEYVTYYRESGLFRGEIRLVEIVLK